MSTQEQVQQLAKSNWLIDLVITGGGTGVLKELLQYGGGSSFLCRAIVPYSKESLDEHFYIGTDKPSVSQETVSIILDRSFGFVSDLAEGKMPVSIVASSKLTYEGERTGRKHLCVLGIETNNINKIYKFSPLKKTRVEQEEEVTQFILSKIFEVLL